MTRELLDPGLLWVLIIEFRHAVKVISAVRRLSTKKLELRICTDRVVQVMKKYSGRTALV
jgi:hypothetical protein